MIPVEPWTHALHNPVDQAQQIWARDVIRRHDRDVVISVIILVLFAFLAAGLVLWGLVRLVAIIVRAVVSAVRQAKQAGQGQAERQSDHEQAVQEAEPG